MFGHEVCDSATAADGNDFLLLSEDMGFRIWAAETFEIATTWLQPVLIVARDEGNLSVNDCCEAVNKLALGGHTYISLDAECLMHQARKDNFIISNEMSCLLGKVGGSFADLFTNSGVLSNFIDILWKECSDELKVKKITSEVFATFVKGRKEEQWQIIGLILKQIRIKERLVREHALDWLIGHSLGMPYFNRLLQMKGDKY